MNNEMTIEKVGAIAGDLCAQPIIDVSFSGSGANSRIFKIKTEKRDYALKFFRKNANDGNSRLAAEMAASKFFRNCNFQNTSELVQHSDEYNCALFNWIEGIKVEQITRLEMDAALSFVKKLCQVEHGPSTSGMPLGIEACISGVEVVNQIKKRLVNLDRSASQHPGFSEFLGTRFKPLFEQIIFAANKVYQSSGYDFSATLKDRLMILSPVDFGFHNAILGSNGLVFFDFEYFGWDDPTHLIADTVLHPGMNISEPDKKFFMEGALDFLRVRDPFIDARYSALIPLYALRWACIILNPFVDTYQVIGAGNTLSEDLVKLRQRQFAKAEIYLEKAQNLLVQLQILSHKLES
jgi:hypothetical protein